MGGGKWTEDAFASISASKRGKSASEIFASEESVDMTPKVLVDKNRESRDSDEHPESLAVMVFVDVTGSMGMVPENIVKNNLGGLMNTIIDNGIKDPQVMFGAIGDHISDNSPLQLGQFESETTLIDSWLTKMYLEGGGGGGNHESYLLAWLTAGRHTSIDCFEKRSVKGFLFTIGDERSWTGIDSVRLKNLMGYGQSEDVTDVQLLAEAQRMYNVYHIHVNTTMYRNDSLVFEYWKKLMGQNFIVLEDYTTICETIATVIAMQNGIDMEKVTSKFDAKTSNTVTNALMVLSKSGDSISKNDTGVIEL
jgi:hypothetical protein